MSHPSVLYRAIPKNADPSQSIKRHSTARLPSNVPYYVDNLWEYARPEGMPSRRYAVYASPTAELALSNASQSAENTVYLLQFKDTAPVHQLSVTDARYHPDIANLQRALNKLMQDMPLAEKQKISVLFLPNVSKEEFTQMAQSNSNLAAMLSELSNTVTMWKDVPSEDGELFFELIGANEYWLQAL